MFQVLFRIPLKPFDWLPSWWPDWTLPIYGFGMMLFLAFLLCTWVASWRARRERISPRVFQDLAVWIFVGGIVGARVVYMIQYGEDPRRFFMIWQGGLVFYGSAIGGFVGYALAYIYVIRRQGLSTWILADAIAPACAVGLCLGRIGCLLNGCCYGNISDADWRALHFPLPSPARYELVKDGYQTAAGFLLADVSRPTTVAIVEADSPAATSGLRANDVIIAANGHAVHSYGDFERLLSGDQWERGQNYLTLDVRRADQQVTVGPFRPQTLGLHPTQIYESISMVFLFLLLCAFYPFRRHPGQLMVLFMVGYSVHRFLNECLRNDTEPFGNGLTLSQNGSVLFLAAAIILEIWLWRRSRFLQPPFPRERQTQRKAKVVEPYVAK
jgi:phosphatidylglycerol:prolipoprotein diacylglycerol transferase